MGPPHLQPRCSGQVTPATPDTLLASYPAWPRLCPNTPGCGTNTSAAVGPRSPCRHSLQKLAPLCPACLPGALGPHQNSCQRETVPGAPMNPGVGGSRWGQPGLLGEGQGPMQTPAQRPGLLRQEMLLALLPPPQPCCWPPLHGGNPGGLLLQPAPGRQGGTSRACCCQAWGLAEQQALGCPLGMEDAERSQALATASCPIPAHAGRPR